MNYNAATGAYVAVSSIDLLEECLDSIYRARANTLEARGQRANAILEKRRAKLHSQSRMRNSFEKVSLPTESIRKDFDEKFSPKEEEIIPSPSRASDPTEAQHAPDSYAAKANKIFEDFRKEFGNWWQSANEEKRLDEDARGEFADYLTDKYMCQKLDIFPPSKEVTSVRKRIYKDIEDFASDGKFPPDLEVPVAGPSQGALLFDQHSHAFHKPHHAAAESKPASHHATKATPAAQRAAETTGVTPAERALAVAAASSAKVASKAEAAKEPPSKEEKRAQERDKIQAQYSSFVKMKQQVQETDKEAKMQDYEKLNDDIRGLLSSLQHGRN